MDLNNLKSCVSHDEAMIDSFVRDPKFADYYLSTVKADGDEYEIRDVQAWYDEAKSRSANMGYWDALLSYAENTALNGYNIDCIIDRVSQALRILQSAQHAHTLS